MLKTFEILEPETVQAASGLLTKYGQDSSLYAGGTELLVIMREGLAHYPMLINVKKIDGLDTIRLAANGQDLVIGAGATHHAIERSKLVAKYASLLAEVEHRVANIRVRVAGTIGGNLSFADPHSDPATLLMAWEGATIELASTEGERSVSPADFFVGLFMTARQDNELLTSVTLPRLADHVGGAYQKIALLERPTANVAAFVTVNEGVITAARLAVGSVGPVPYRAVAAEALLLGEKPGGDAPLYKAAGEAAAAAADPINDLYGSAEYKRQLVSVLTARALKQAVQRSTGEDAA